VHRCILSFTAFILACGGVAPMIVTTVPPSAPRIRASGALSVQGQGVLVVSPGPLLRASIVVGPDGAAGAIDTGGYDVATSALESALLRVGAQPVSQAAIAQMLMDAQVRTAIGASQGDGAIVEQAIVLGRATTAPLVLVIRSLQYGYAQDPIAQLGSVAGGCREWRVRPAEVAIDVALLRVADAAVLWTGQATVRATDLLPEPMTLAAGPGHTIYNRDYGDIRVVTTGDSGNACEGSDIPGYTCWEVLNNDCGAGEGQGARPISPPALEALVGRAVTELVGNGA
jgi:hypothetical protein